MAQYKCRYFDIKELVPPEVYYALGEKAWSLFDDRALITLDELREAFGACTVNDWSFGGKFTESGLRVADCKHYSQFSRHSFGAAFDCKFKDFTPQEVQEIIMADPTKFKHISRIESTNKTLAWLHFDVGNFPHKGIHIFYP